MCPVWKRNIFGWLFMLIASRKLTLPPLELGIMRLEFC